MTDFSRCIHCSSCASVCPSGGPWHAGQKQCSACGSCARACPADARMIAGRYVEASEILDQLDSDRIFFEESGGGITLSGGEPLSQADFSAELLEGCRKIGISTALDTSGYGSRENLLMVAAFADLILYDLKGMDPKMHELNTGVPLAPILDNLTTLCESGARIWLRIPVIPGYNDDPAGFDEMARFVSALKGIEHAHILPCHRLGDGKLSRLGRSSDIVHLETPEPEALQRAAAPFRAVGLKTHIGG